MAIKNNSRSLLFPRIGKFSMVIFALLLIISGIRAFEIFGYIFKENVTQNSELIIPSGSDFEDVEEIIEEKELLQNYKAFNWVSKKKSYKDSIIPGRYVIEKGWTTNDFVNVLRAGKQTPIKVTFNNVRFFDELAGKISSYFEFDSTAILSELTKPEIHKKYGFTLASFHAMFIPNTYEFYWTASPDNFIDRMHTEYQRFWNDERKKKAKNINLTPVEVSTLASIVQEETIKPEEKPKVAGLYLNRLQRGMLLQADPTINLL